MEDLLDQIEAAGHTGLWQVALFSTLGLPDICAALSAHDGRTSKARYIVWFDQNIDQAVSGSMSAEDAYYFRCSIVHQGSTQNPASSYQRIFFVEPTAPALMHGNQFNNTLNIYLRIFCFGVVASVRKWMQVVAGTEPYLTNSNNLLRRRPEGLPPYVVWVPVIA